MLCLYEIAMETDQIAAALARIGVIMRSFAWEQSEGADLTPTQAQILARLAARGPSRTGSLAADLGVTQPTVSDAVAALLRKGHVARGPDLRDGRAVLLRLTESGRRPGGGGPRSGGWGGGAVAIPEIRGGPGRARRNAAARVAGGAGYAVAQGP